MLAVGFVLLQTLCVALMAHKQSVHPSCIVDTLPPHNHFSVHLNQIHLSCRWRQHVHQNIRSCFLSYARTPKTFIWTILAM